MIRRRSLSLALAASLATTCPLYGSAQRTPTQKHGADSSSDELSRRFNQQRAAEQSGEPTAVAQTSQQLAAVALRELAHIRLLEGVFPQSIKLYQDSLNLEDSPDTRVDLAIAYMRLRDGKAAVAEAQRAEAALPNNARALHVAGKACMMVQDYKCATVALRRSVELDPDLDAALALGVAYLAMHDKENAAAVFQQMIQVAGDHSIFHIRFGRAYRDAEYTDDAIREFKRAIALDPVNNHPHYFLGVVYMIRNEWGANPEARHEFEEEVHVDPQGFYGNYFLGAMESGERRFVESNRHLQIAAKAKPNWPEAWLYLGLNAYAEEKYPAAQQYLRKAIELTGSDDARNNYQIRRADFALGRILMQQGKRDQAAPLLKKAREMESKGLADSQRKIAAMSPDAMGAGAVARLDKEPETTIDTAKIDSTAPAEASHLARADLTPSELKQVQARDKELRAVLGSAFNDWGTAEAKQQQYGEALIHFHEAERWAPETPGLMRNIGIAAFRVEGYPEAVRALSAAVEQDPNDQRSRSMLAVSQFTLEHYAEAVAAFQPLGDAVYSDPRMAYAFAYSLSRSNHPKEAGGVLDKLTAQHLQPDMLVLAGQVYGDIGNYEHAVTCFRAASQQSPSLPQAHYGAGAALIHLDRPADAIPELQAELKLAPTNADAQYYLAYAMLQTSQKDQAEALLRSVIASHPEHAQAQYELGKELLESGQTAEAIQHLEIAVRAEPDRDYIHYQLQSAYRKAGRTADADRELHAYREIKARNRERTLPQMEQHADVPAQPSADRPR